MSSSLPQPLVSSYPPPISAQLSPHSKGSFGPVLAVLAVITVVTIVACIIGRLCARRLCTPKPPPMDHPQDKDDVEHAFGASIPAAKPVRHAGPKGEVKPTGNKMLGRDAMKKYPDIRGAKVDIKHHGPNFGAKPREG